MPEEIFAGVEVEVLLRTDSGIAVDSTRVVRGRAALGLGGGGGGQLEEEGRQSGRVRREARKTAARRGLGEGRGLLLAMHAAAGRHSVATRSRTDGGGGDGPPRQT